MTIIFAPLQENHLSLLFKWMEDPRVKIWWDRDVQWTYEMVQEKYGLYATGVKRFFLNGKMVERPMHAYIIQYEGHDIGYIQYFNRHDFPPEWEYTLPDMPKSCAGFDWYIGECEYTGKGIGSKALSMFLDQYVFPNFEYVFADPETENKRAIRVYEKIGFETCGIVHDGTTEITEMLKYRPSVVVNLK